MRKAIIGLAVGLLALAAVGVVSAQEGRVDTPCAGYAVDVRQEADGYGMLLTVPVPPIGFKSLYLEIDGQSHISPEGDANNEFRVSYTVFDIGSGHHYYASSMARDGGLIVYSCTDIGTFEVKL